MKVLFHNGTIITRNKQGNVDVLTNGAFAVNDGEIIKIGKSTDFSLNENWDKKVNLNEQWVLPGLVNTHGHTGMAILRGYADDMNLQKWLQTKIWPLEKNMNQESIKWSSALAMLEMAKSGTTTFLDMYHPLYMEEVAQLVAENGMRAVLMNGMIGLCSKEEQKEKLLKAESFVTNWHQTSNDRITTMLAPHSLYTCPPSFIEDIVQLANQLNVPIHTHMSETEKEVQDCLANFGDRPAVHLHKLGVFQKSALIAHGVHLNEEELEIIKGNDVSISHNPISNLKLGSGIANIALYIENNVNVSLGTDSAASNNNLDMFEEMRTAALLQKGFVNNPEVINAATAFSMATINGAKALQLPNIGALEVGKRADFITINYKNKAHLQPFDNVLSHLVYSASGKDVTDVYVDGNLIVENGKSVTMDEEKIIYEANRIYKKLCM
jgi:5-methylthioadenosine/S-adenosylhomocysteine deaminase